MGFAHVAVFLCLVIATTTAADPSRWLKRFLNDDNKCLVDGNVYQNGEEFDRESECNCRCNGADGYGCVGCGVMGCPHGEFTPKDKCCPVCRLADDVCEIDGVVYENGQTFHHGSECNCRCNGASGMNCVGCGVMGCPHGEYTPEGECCPVCKEGCDIDGKRYEVGERFHKGSECNCLCDENGEHGCVGCGTGFCPNGEFIPEGECCPVCKPIIEPPRGCQVDGKLYRTGEIFHRGSQCNCRCDENGEHGCVGCGTMFCPNGEFQPEGECCPVCNPRFEPPRVYYRELQTGKRNTGGCHVDGVDHLVGAKFDTKDICNCECKNDDEVACVGCPASVCPNGEHTPEGKCCPECI